MPSFCVVSNCEFKYVHSPNISFHKFPFHTDSILRQWIQFTDRGEFWLPSRWSSICSRHFLPNDFRDHVTRKCLKRFAVPSITIKSIDCTSISLSTANNKIAEFAQTMCRLCARTFIGTITKTRSLEDPLVAAALYKCCPTVPLHLDDALPQKICSECSSQLNRFATFVDRIVSVQADLLQRFELGEPVPETSEPHFTSAHIDEPHSRLVGNFNAQQIYTAPRIFKIKQEPFVNVKQEIVDSTRAVAQSAGIDFVPDSDAFCEFCDAYFINNVELKNHIVKYHSNDSESEPVQNNCEIMEIITLGNAFINLAEEDNNNGGERDGHHDLDHSSDMIPLEQVLKVEYLTEYEQREQREQNRQSSFVLDEHCYSRLPDAPQPPLDAVVSESEHNEHYSTLDYMHDINDNSLIGTSEPIDSRQLQQTILDAESSTLYQCAECSQQYTDQTLLDDHIAAHQGANDDLLTTLAIIPRHRHRQRAAVKCVRCHKRFASKLAMTSHLKARCVRRVLRCRLCRRVFSKVSKMRLHESHCGKSTGRRAVQERVRRMECNQVGGRFACTLCDRTYTRRSNFNRHFVSHLPRNQWSTMSPKCIARFDPDPYATQNVPLTLQADNNSPPGDLHLATTIFSQSEVATTTTTIFITNPPARPVECEACGKMFKNPQTLRQHRATHQRNATFACSLCDKVFKRVAGLNQHVNGFHYKIKRHTCTVCNYSYALKGDMTRCRHSTLKGHYE